MEGVRWDIVLTAAVPIALLLVLGLVLLGGRLSAETRRRVELGLALLFHPLFAGFFLWKSVGAGSEGDWLTCGGWAVFALFIAWNGVRVVRTLLVSGSRRAAAS
ncbi:hypothetical protein [Brevundimonas sp. NPDC058933]|uniref:hypothetical protein n=1 Tax=Brevundimonas sp. NPDC058933 TaxID=3346673 RepID=UPI003BEEF62F